MIRLQILPDTSWPTRDFGADILLSVCLLNTVTQQSHLGNLLKVGIPRLGGGLLIILSRAGHRGFLGGSQEESFLAYSNTQTCGSEAFLAASSCFLLILYFFLLFFFFMFYLFIFRKEEVW